jgi:hypothetical protein
MINWKQVDTKNPLELLPLALQDALEENDPTIFVAAIRSFPKFIPFIHAVSEELQYTTEHDIHMHSEEEVNE